ncbi:hypothetical protein COC46_19160 [Bacillus sp. AFS041924]|nr:hypothetical protein [Bacillus sp. AFS041924]PGS47966.1 hypothetical protein COC46_19160 [Bacillus sp. AFS041924]
MIQEGFENPVELWSLGGDLTALATVSIYNSESSTGPLIIEVISKSSHLINVLPGNTSSYTSMYINLLKFYL